jgi:tRNA-dihydrouridine synthase B
VRIPVTVKMRAGWDDAHVNAAEMARRMEDAGASAVAVHGRTAKQSYRGASDWGLIGEVAAGVRIPVMGSGDCVTPEQVVDRTRGTGVSGVLVGRGALRNPWIFQQSTALASGLPVPAVSPAERGRFLLEYIDLLLAEGVDESNGFRHHAPGSAPSPSRTFRRPGQRERWVVNKLRALGSWYTKGLRDGGRLRTAINRAESVEQLRDLVSEYFFLSAGAGPPE